MRRILAIGGGGFNGELPDHAALDRFFLRLTGKVHPKVCFVSTAAGDAPRSLWNFYRAAESLDCSVSTIELFRPKPEPLADQLSRQDAVFVGGGSTRNLLVLWRHWGLDVALRNAYEAGVVVGGVSAGANCWFKECVTDSNPGQLSALRGLGWIDGSFCPHFDSEPDRRPRTEALVETQELGPGWAVEEGVGVLFEDEKAVRVVTTQERRTAYRYSLRDGHCTFAPEPADHLV